MLYIYVAVREASFENSALYYYSTTTLSNNKFEIVDSDMSLLTDYGFSLIKVKKINKLKYKICIFLKLCI